VSVNEFLVPVRQLMDELNAKTLAEVYDNSNGRQTVNLSQIDDKNLSKIKKKTTVNSQNIGSNYYMEIEKDVVNKDGTRSIVLTAKNTSGSVIAKKTHTPTVMGLIGEDYFEDMENEIVNNIKKENEQIIVEPRIENFSIKIDEETTSVNGQKTLTVTAIDENGIILVKKTYKPTINEVLGEHYFDDIIEDIENDIKNSKLDDIKKASMIPQKISANLSRHTFGSKDSQPTPKKGKYTYFMNLIGENTFNNPSYRNFSLPTTKEKSKSAIGRFNVNEEQPNKSSEYNQPNRSGTAYNERPSKLPKNILFNEEVVQRPSYTGVSLNGNKLVLATPQPVEGAYEERDEDNQKVTMKDLEGQKKKAEGFKMNQSNFIKTISSVNPNESLYETNNMILQKSQEMKNQLENYIESIKQLQESQMNESQKLHNKSNYQDDELIRKKVYEVFLQEKDKLSEQIYAKLKRGSVGNKEENVMDEFYEFCRTKLPNDDMYKESVLFVSLFYYFLEKKNLIK